MDLHVQNQFKREIHFYGLNFGEGNYRGTQRQQGRRKSTNGRKSRISINLVAECALLFPILLVFLERRARVKLRILT